MPSDPAPPDASRGTSAVDLRRAREAQALRDNLRRRKEQQRAREHLGSPRGTEGADVPSAGFDTDPAR